MFVHIQAYIADYVAFSYSFEEGRFLPLTLSLFLLLVLELCLSSFLKILTKFGWAYFKYSEPDFNFFSPLKRPKSEHYCGQIGERISGVKIGDAPPKSELLASLGHGSHRSWHTFFKDFSRTFEVHVHFQGLFKENPKFKDFSRTVGTLEAWIPVPAKYQFSVWIIE